MFISCYHQIDGKAHSDYVAQPMSGLQIKFCLTMMKLMKREGSLLQRRL